MQMYTRKLILVRIISRRPARKKSKTGVTAASAPAEHVAPPTPDLHKVCKKCGAKSTQKRDTSRRPSTNTAYAAYSIIQMHARAN